MKAGGSNVAAARIAHGGGGGLHARGPEGAEGVGDRERAQNSREQSQADHSEGVPLERLMRPVGPLQEIQLD